MKYLGKFDSIYRVAKATFAALAQLVEQHFCKVWVLGSSPRSGSEKLMKVSIQKQEFEVSPDDLAAVNDFIVSLVPGFIKEAGAALQDGVKGWRTQNAVKILLKTRNLIRDSGLTPQELSGKFFVGAFDKLSIEEDETLQERWAALLANASTGRCNQDVKYISILSELNHQEAKLLTTLSSGWVESNPVLHGAVFEQVFSSQKVAEHLGIDMRATKIIIDNFYRLNLCQAPAMEGISVGNQKALLRSNDVFTFTDLGKDFLLAVK